MQYSDQELIDGVLAGNPRAVARLITLAENQIPRAQKIQAQLFQHTGRAQVIGVTGSPGAGKSTLVDAMAAHWKSSGKKIAIVAIDPTSPFSGGAVLGDRIRMSRVAEDQNIFIRSMATRGSLGGIARATIDAVQILDAAGFDVILVETVGVGQAEIDIVRLADTCIVVLVPGMGDSVQAFKAGILEIADVFAINKADREGADQVQKDLRVLISLADQDPKAWKQEIVQTVATTSVGVHELLHAVNNHLHWLSLSQQGIERRRMILEHTIRQIAQELVVEGLSSTQSERFQALVSECAARKIDPYSAAERLVHGN
ncbi:MAG: methylmalonyl Co-A mutase-associated GTPase MeaB [Oligoflexia bacterium]|nr:methylmalonyl Co-A mutase-associated GTPase MeaB [Oligoflexia bacterium]